MADQSIHRLNGLTRGTAITGMAGLLLGATSLRANAQTVGPELAVGVPPNDSSGPMMYGVDAGFYEKAGLNIKLTVLNNPGPITAAIVSGAMAIGGLSVATAALARSKGLPVVLIAPLSLYLSTSPTNAMIVLKDSPLRKASDLNGKTVATRDLTNMSYLGANVWIDKNGGDSKSIRWIELNDPQAMAAMQSGRIDAASISEPALDTALQNGGRVLGAVFDAIAKRFLVAGCATSEAFVKANPQIVRAYADAIAATAKWANENRDKSGKILEKYANAPVLPGSTRVTYAERLRASDVQPVLDIMFSSGQIKSAMRASELFSTAVPTS